MKNIIDFLNEQFEENNEVELNESKIESEESFRKAAKEKFEEVFGDKLDEKKMNKTIDGLLKNNKDLVEDGKWGQLIGMLNKSFNESEEVEEPVIESEEIDEAKCCSYDSDKLKRMSEDELWDAIGEVAYAKAQCRSKKDSKGEEECANTLKEIREILKSKK